MPVSIKQRVRDLRRNQTEVEHLLWERLRNRKCGGNKFVRQYPFPFEYHGKKRLFIADFYCHDGRLAIELDGSVHAKHGEYDKIRTEILQIMGLRIIRFSNKEIFNNIEAVLTAIENAILLPSLSREGQG